MKQLTDTQLIQLLSVILGITFALFGIMIYYFRNEVQHLVEFLNQSFKREQENVTKWYEKCKEANDDNIRLIKEKKFYFDLYEKLFKLHFEVCSKFEKLKEHNKKYSTICRKLYNENYNLKYDNKHLEEKCKNSSLEIEELKLKNQGLESLFADMKNKANEFELKITELESKKLKERKKDEKKSNGY